MIVLFAPGIVCLLGLVLYMKCNGPSVPSVKAGVLGLWMFVVGLYWLVAPFAEGRTTHLFP